MYTFEDKIDLFSGGVFSCYFVAQKLLTTLDLYLKKCRCSTFMK